MVKLSFIEYHTNKKIDYEGYFIDENGECYSNKFNGLHKLKQRPNKKGYPYIGLSVHNKVAFRSVHRCALSSFKPDEWFEGAVCNHIDENVKNNKIENLEWTTEEFNHNWGTRNKRAGNKLKGKLNNHSSRPVIQFDLQGNFIKEYNSISEAHRETGISLTNISECCQGKRKTAGGYVWKYKETV